MREIKATFSDGTREKIRNSPGTEYWRDNDGSLRFDGKLFRDEIEIERATQIAIALDGLTIREAQDLLNRLQIHLLNSVFTPDR